MSKRIGLYPRVRVEGGGRGSVSQAGAVLLVETVGKSGLDTAISAAMAQAACRARPGQGPAGCRARSRSGRGLPRRCRHAAGRARPIRPGGIRPHGLPSHRRPRRSRPQGPGAIRSARAEVRTRVWGLAGADGPAADGSVIVDIDGVLVLAHSEKQDATATRKKTFGHHPLVVFVDHGQASSGEPVAALPRPANAGSNTANDHITTTRLALAQLPKHLRRGRQTLIRTDSAGGTHAFLNWCTRPGRWLSYSVGMTITDTIHQAVLKIPKKAWTPAYDADGTERPGAWVADITDMPDLSTWPKLDV